MLATLLILILVTLLASVWIVYQQLKDIISLLSFQVQTLQLQAEMQAKLLKGKTE